MLGNSIIEKCIYFTTGKKISDPTSGMRLYDSKCIKLFALGGLDPEPDTVAFLIRSGANVGEMQVKMADRMAGDSYLNITNSIKYMFDTCLSILVVQWFRRKVKICQLD